MLDWSEPCMAEFEVHMFLYALMKYILSAKQDVPVLFLIPPQLPGMKKSSVNGSYSGSGFGIACVKYWVIKDVWIILVFCFSLLSLESQLNA